MGRHSLPDRHRRRTAAPPSTRAATRGGDRDGACSLRRRGQRCADRGRTAVAGDGTQRDRLPAAFSDLEPVPDGATGLCDTTLAAYKEAIASYGKGKFNALVILTDG